MCSVLIPEKSEQFFVFLSDIFKVGETAKGRYCFTGNRERKELRENKNRKYNKIEKYEFRIALDQ